VLIGREPLRQAVAYGHAAWSLPEAGTLTFDLDAEGQIAATASLSSRARRTGRASPSDFTSAFGDFGGRVRELLASELPDWLDDPWIREMLCS